MRLLVRNLAYAATFDDAERELAAADVLIDDGVFAAVGQRLPTDEVDRVIDGTGLVALPGLINAHQHLYQGAFRAVPRLERIHVGPWLAELSALCMERWENGRFTPEVVGTIARAVLAESLLGGVTTVADQHYFFPAGASDGYIEATVEAAKEVGVRLHACRGSITLDRDGGGAADPRVAQPVEEVVRHCAALIDEFHDARPDAAVRVALAPCGVHADRPELFSELAALAEDHDGVRLHTHLYEKVDAEFCRATYGTTPWRVLADNGWAGPRTWLAHVVDPPAYEIGEMAAAGVGLVHLPAPDLRLGWGVAPVRAFLDAGITLGFGTTGSASNDGADLLGDLRLAALVHRHADEPPERWPSARELLRATTRGSADCLGRPELGRIATGAVADLSAWDLRTVDRIGVHDPLAGLVLTGLSSRASLVIVGGEVLVEGSEPIRFDPGALAAAARAVSGSS